MTAVKPPDISEIGQIAIFVGDVAQATVFYRDVLGLKFLFPAGPAMAFLAAGSVRIRLTTPQAAGEAGKNPILDFKVADLVAPTLPSSPGGAMKESEPRLIAKMPDHELWMAAVRDPEGNVIELMSEVRK